MKTIHNRTLEPLRIPLGAGKVLHLGPGQKGQIADDAVSARGVRRLIESGAIVVEGDAARAGEFGGGHETPREDAHGHAQGSKVFPSGNRGG